MGFDSQLQQEHEERDEMEVILQERLCAWGVLDWFWVGAFAGGPVFHCSGRRKG